MLEYLLRRWCFMTLDRQLIVESSFIYMRKEDFCDIFFPFSCCLNWDNDRHQKNFPKSPGPLATLSLLQVAQQGTANTAGFYQHTYGALHLFQGSESGARVGSRSGCSSCTLEKHVSIVVASIVSQFQLVAAQYVVVCAWKQSNSMCIVRCCSLLSVHLFKDTKNRPGGE